MLIATSYIDRYLVKGDRFYDQDTTLFLHRLYKVPSVKEADAPNSSFLDEPDAVGLFDSSGSYILQASVDVVDGSVAELKDRASGQLLVMRDTLRQAVNLTPGDRLALDTRAPNRR